VSMLKRDVFVLIFAVSTVLLAVLFALTSELGYGMGKLELTELASIPSRGETRFGFCVFMGSPG